MSSSIVSTHDDLILKATARLRMAAQNRTRYLNSIARVFRSSTINISNVTWTVITFDSESFDTDSIHSTSVNTSRLNIQLTGKYLIVAGAVFPGNATGTRWLTVEANANGVQGGGSGLLTTNAVPDPTGAFGAIFQGVGLVTLTAGDYIELFFFQNSGVTLACDATLQMCYLGE